LSRYHTPAINSLIISHPSPFLGQGARERDGVREELESKGLNTKKEAGVFYKALPQRSMFLMLSLLYLLGNQQFYQFVNTIPEG
jgi:hypothetical protein